MEKKKVEKFHKLQNPSFATRKSTQRRSSIRWGGTSYICRCFLLDLQSFSKAKFRIRKEKGKSISNLSLSPSLIYVPLGGLEGAYLQILPSLLLPNIQTMKLSFHNDSKEHCFGMPLPHKKWNWAFPLLTRTPAFYIFFGVNAPTPSLESPRLYQLWFM